MKERNISYSNNKELVEAVYEHDLPFPKTNNK
jgi:hypothetical protein